MSDRDETCAGARAARCQGSRSRGPAVRTALAGGVLLGAGVAFFFDACQGAARRARLRGWLSRAGGASKQQPARPLPDDHPLMGLPVRARLPGPLEAGADAALTTQARAAIARAVAHPDAVRVTAGAGIITLRGAVAASELKPLLRRVADVRGVEIVENKLTIQEEAEHAPGTPPGS